MRCKIHPYANAVGVCAPCLCDRLFALVAAENGASPIPSPSPPPPPPPLAFPRSVPPYASGGRSGLLFSRTPQIGGEKEKGRKFSILSTIFGHSRSAEPSRTSSWLKGILHGGRRRKPQQSDSPPQRRPYPARDRGMSPESREDDDSGYSTESSPWRPMPTPMRRVGYDLRRHHHGGGAMSGFAVCLSPLVRPSPGHRRCHVADAGFSGELRRAKAPQHHRHGSAGSAASLHHHRSNKLAHLGRLR
ncbi:uncharacterized protein [Typha latifolia]|uniref:uncharacterized protein n=1 Tax=Typha latifolia TaxID=4733 RepID=UPI003C2D8832